MSDTVSPQEALIYVMVMMSAVDREMSDNELRRIGEIVQRLPAFKGFDAERDLLVMSQTCSEKINEQDGLDRVLSLIARSLPEHLHETAYALAVEVAAADLAVEWEEVRLLQLLRERISADKLVCAAIERSAHARHRSI